MFAANVAVKFIDKLGRQVRYYAYARKRSPKTGKTGPSSGDTQRQPLTKGKRSFPMARNHRSALPIFSTTVQDDSAHSILIPARRFRVVSGCQIGASPNSLEQTGPLRTLV